MQKMRLAAAGLLSGFFILMSGNAQTVLAQPVLEVSLLSDSFGSILVIVNTICSSSARP